MHLKSYTLEYKLKVVEYVSLYNVSIATKEFNVAKSNIYRWVNNQENLRQGVKDKNKMCRKIHDGRKPILGIELENQIKEWFCEQRLQGNIVNMEHLIYIDI